MRRRMIAAIRHGIEAFRAWRNARADARHEGRLPWSHKRRIRQARRVLDRIAPWVAAGDGAKVFAYLRKVDPLVFEELVLECLSRSGLRIRRGTRYSGDGGVDGHVWVDGRLCPIQCKRYRNTIDPKHVAAFVDQALHSHAPVAFFIHTGRTGDLSREAARGAPVVMVSGSRLLRLLAGVPPLTRKENQ